MKKGQKHSLETREKLRLSHLGYKQTEAHRKAISISNQGGNRTSFKKGQQPWNFGKTMSVEYGTKLPNYKGDKVSYTGLHQWVRRKLGTPSICQHCGRTKAPKFEWANVSKKYKRDLTDWVRLCVPCHKVFDGNVS